jgi:lysozyme
MSYIWSRKEAVAPKERPFRPHPDDVKEILIPLIKRFEGIHDRDKSTPILEAVWDTHGRVWTAGWGETGPDITEGTKWTLDQAEARLIARVRFTMDRVDTMVKVPLTVGQWAALTDFAYNLGVGALQRSTLLKKLNAGLYADAAAEFERWNQAGGQVLNGLVRRRKAERELFEGGVSV